MIESDKAVMQMALDALENSCDFVFKDTSKSHLRGVAIHALRAAIAQPEPKAGHHQESSASAASSPIDGDSNTSYARAAIAQPKDKP